MRLTSLVLVLALAATACNPLRGANSRVISNKDLGAKADGYSNLWVCAGKVDPKSNQFIVVTLAENTTDASKHFLAVEKRTVSIDKQDLTVSNQGLFWSDLIEIKNSELGQTVVSSEDNSLQYAIINKNHTKVVLTVPKQYVAPITIYCNLRQAKWN